MIRKVKRKSLRPSVEDRIAKLERAFFPRTPGTIISRVQMDTSMLAGLGLSKLHDRESHIMWSFGIGGLMEPKIWLHGHTIEEALSRAEKEVKSLEGRSKRRSKRRLRKTRSLTTP